MKDSIRDPDYWRERAGKTRAKADGFFNLKTKVRLLRVAEEYDRLAERAERWKMADQFKEQT